MSKKPIAQQPPAGLWPGPDEKLRCTWCRASQAYTHYHDTEWGFPTLDDRTLFEKLCLEGFQAGLSWLTILNKRENFRRAFDGFDHEQIARYDERDVKRLLGDSGIIRHRGKIESTINNARRMLELTEEFGSLCAYAWLFEPSRPERGGLSLAQMRANSTPIEAEQLSRDLKQRGWRFVGPTTMYAFMQAMGLVNDHLSGCVIEPQVHTARQALGYAGG